MGWPQYWVKLLGSFLENPTETSSRDSVTASDDHSLVSDHGRGEMIGHWINGAHN